MNLLYLVGSSVVVAVVLFGVMTVLTPKKGFTVVGERIVVKCNNCGTIQPQRENMRCRQCSNVGDTRQGEIQE